MNNVEKLIIYAKKKKRVFTGTVLNFILIIACYIKEEYFFLLISFLVFVWDINYAIIFFKNSTNFE